MDCDITKLSYDQTSHISNHTNLRKMLILLNGLFYRSEFGQLELSHCSIFELSNWQEAGD